MVEVSIWSPNLSEWHGRLRDPVSGMPVGEEWIATQRGELIGRIRNQLPLTHLRFVDVGHPGP